MIIAALDIGSNSIHLVVVETDREKPFRVVSSAKEVVRLGRSATRDERLSGAAMDRAIEGMKRFRRIAESHGARDLIAVATSAVREATNGDQFLARAAEEAGVEIDLLSGIEEARLIALAVSVRYERSRRQQGAGGNEERRAYDADFVQARRRAPDRAIREIRPDRGETVAPPSFGIT